MRRLSVIDGIFLRAHQGAGTPIALQGLWRTTGTVDLVQLHRLRDALCTGPLARRVARSRVPGASPRWQPNQRAHSVDWGPELRPAEILSWADRQGEDLDPQHGPGWRLSAAPLTDGGTIITLTCSHVLADARGLIIAVEQGLLAVRGETVPSAGAEQEGNDDECGPHGSGGDPESDWAAAADTWATVLSGTARMLRDRLRWTGPETLRREPVAPGLVAPAEDGRPDSDRPICRAGDSAADSGPADRSGPHSEMPVPAVVLRCRAADWDRIASGHGGTANSLFIWLVANTLWAGGYPGREIAASLPVDTRAEPRIDNELAMTEIMIAPTDSPADIRAKSRVAYERRISSPGGLPEEFLHLVPDRVAYLLSRGAGERDILCSNIGTIPPGMHTLGSHHCTGLATRAIHPGLTYARRPRTRLSGYLCHFRDDYVLTLASLDPERFHDSAGLQRFAVHTAQRMDLPIGPW